MYIRKMDSIELVEVKSQAILDMVTKGTYMSYEDYEKVKALVESNILTINSALATGYWANHPDELSILRNGKNLNMQALRMAEQKAKNYKDVNKMIDEVIYNN